MRFDEKASRFARVFLEIEEDELPDRSFIWGTIETLKRDAWQTMLKDVRKARILEEVNQKTI